jgi:ectoine hydroxylase-related dioxygenase (phytanoyl-CoA dioxygenase family)
MPEEAALEAQLHAPTVSLKYAQYQTQDNAMLSAQQLRQYQEEGCIVVENVIDAPTRAAMLRQIDAWVESAKGVSAHDNVYDLEPTHTPQQPRVRRVKKPHTLAPLFWDVLKSEPLLTMLKQILGPNIRLHGSKLNIKAPRYGSPVEWHQDWAFYPHTNDDLLAVAMMLEDTSEANGAMLYLPGTHKGRTYDHHAEGHFCGAMDALSCGLDFSKAVVAKGKAGAVSIHHVRLVHGSAQNTSNLPRPLMLYELGAADAWPLVPPPPFNFEEFNSRMLAGAATLEPRFVHVPVRMPYPPAPNQGSIYENQSVVKNRFFEVKQA